MTAKRYIMLHHSLTADGATVSWGAIRKYHVETNGWRDVGYHYGIERIGDALEVLLGRNEEDHAAACKEARMNALAVHVCCVGNFDVEAPSAELLKKLASLLRSIMLRHGLEPRDIVAHRDFATYKTCPGSLFDLEAVRRLVQ